MIPGIPVVDLMKRTMHNLKTIEQMDRSSGGVYEVTQLVNSFLAALAYPWEEWKVDSYKMSLAEATEKGWPQFKKSDPLDDDPKDLRDLLRLVRNAFAHGNIAFVPDGQGNISMLEIWNEDNGYRTWGTKATLLDIRQFLVCFVEHAHGLGSPRPRNNRPHRNDPIRGRPRKVECPTCGGRVSPDRIRTQPHRECQMSVEEKLRR